MVSPLLHSTVSTILIIFFMNSKTIVHMDGAMAVMQQRKYSSKKIRFFFEFSIEITKFLKFFYVFLCS